MILYRQAGLCLSYLYNYAISMLCHDLAQVVSAGVGKGFYNVPPTHFRYKINEHPVLVSITYEPHHAKTCLRGFSTR